MKHLLTTFYLALMLLPQTGSAEIAELAARFEQAAHDRGYAVQRGVYRYFEKEDCRELIEAIGNCMGNNPASPYGLAFLPAAPGEHLPAGGMGEIRAVPGMRPTWQLQSQEAVVLVGVTPPRNRYFGFRSYLASRAVDGERKLIAASLGDSLNHVSLKHAGTSPYETTVGVITSADASVEREIAQLLTLAGLDERAINRDRIPVPKVKLGYGADRDDFTLFGRVAYFADPDRGQEYLAAPPVAVFRLRPTAPRPSQPPGVPSLAQRQGNPESGLEAAMDALVQGVRRAMGRLLVPALPTIKASILIGLRCIDWNVNCLGDNTDTTYSASLIPMALDDTPASVVTVVGVNHTATGNAEYTNVSAYHSDKLMGVVSVSDARFQGSVVPYLDYVPLLERRQVQAVQHKLYVHHFAYTCGSRAYCTELPEGEFGVPIGDSLRIIERAYVKPGTAHGPSYDKIVPPKILLFP